MKVKIDSLNHESNSLREVEDKQDVLTNREDFNRTNTYRGRPGMDNIIEVGQDMILIIEVIMAIIREVTQDMGDKIIIETDWGVTLEIKVMEEMGVDHMKGKPETITEGTIEVSVTVGQGKVQE